MDAILFVYVIHGDTLDRIYLSDTGGRCHNLDRIGKMLVYLSLHTYM